MDPHDPKWVEYRNSFTLTNIHGKISTQDHDVGTQGLFSRVAWACVTLLLIWAAAAIVLSLGR